MKYVVFRVFRRGGVCSVTTGRCAENDGRMLCLRRCTSARRALPGGRSVDSAGNAVALRMKDGKVQVTDGPYAETKETLGGILLLEARDLNHAIALMSKHPGVRITTTFEIRPVNEAISRLIAERSTAVAST